jgi:hypothetical protein
MLDGGIQHLLYPVDIGRKHGNHDSLIRRLLKYLFKNAPDRALAHRIALGQHVGAFAEEKAYAPRAQLREPLQIHRLALNRRKVYLKIAGMDNRTYGGLHRYTHRIRYGMGGADEFHVKASHGDRFAGVDAGHFGLGGKAVFLQFVGYKAQREPRAVDARAYLPQEVGYAAYMVFMGVGEEEAAYFMPVLGQIGEVRYHEVNAQHLVLGKGHAAINDNQIVAVLKYGHILSDFAQAAQGKDAEFIFFGCQ